MASWLSWPLWNIKVFFNNLTECNIRTTRQLQGCAIKKDLAIFFYYVAHQLFRIYTSLTFKYSTNRTLSSPDKLITCLSVFFLFIFCNCQLVNGSGNADLSKTYFNFTSRIFGRSLFAQMLFSIALVCLWTINFSVRDKSHDSLSYSWITFKMMTINQSAIKGNAYDMDVLVCETKWSITWKYTCSKV